MPCLGLLGRDMAYVSGAGGGAAPGAAMFAQLLLHFPDSRACKGWGEDTFDPELYMLLRCFVFGEPLSTQLDWSQDNFYLLLLGR